MTIWQRGVNTLRDLKHLIRSEEQLRAANNELVKQACAEGINPLVIAPKRNSIRAS